jgi:DNA-binding GntR family transcriptional regulator
MATQRERKLTDQQGNMEPIAYKSKAHATYVELRRRIMGGELAAGAVINQEQLAGGLGVSTTPLREALRMLESEGLVRSRTHRDIVVAPLDPDEVVQLFEVRRHLDALAARLAAVNHDDAAREALESAAGKIHGDTDDPVAANRLFHRSIYLASKNDVLIEVLEALWDRSDRYRRFTRGIADRADTVAEHDALAQAVLSRDAAKAERLMRAHLEAAQAVISQAVAATLREDTAADQVAAPSK